MNYRTMAILELLVLVMATGCLKAQGQSANIQFDQYGRWVNGVSEPWMFAEALPKSAVAAVQQKWSAMESENTESDNGWSGVYFEGSDVHGSYLRWSRRNGFVLLHVDKCAAMVMGFSYGNTIFAADRIKFNPIQTLSSRAGHNHATPPTERYLPVSWRGDRYLVPEDEIADFGNYLAGLGKYNHWAGIEIDDFLVKLEPTGRDQLATRTGSDPATFELPTVPPGFERFLKRPIDVTVTAVGKGWVRRNPENEWWDDLIVPVTINAGQTNGVTRGMKFRTQDQEEILVTKVGAHHSQAMIVRTTRKKPCVKFSKDDDCSEPDDAPVSVGLVASTSPYRYDRRR